MTQIVGGLRARLIHDNIYYMIRDGLDELGWLGPSLQHETVSVRQTPVGEDEIVKPNIISVVVEDDTEDPAEMGSLLTDFKWAYYVDVYAESDALALHLAKDIVDIMNGRFSATVSRGGPNIAIYDLTASHATPVTLFTVEVEGVRQDRSRFFVKPYQEHWRVVSFLVNDTYGTEED
jgi:hypothetical protein